MPASTAKKLSSLFRSAINSASAVEDIALKQYVSSIDTSSPSSSQTVPNRLNKSSKRSKLSSSAKPLTTSLASQSLQFHSEEPLAAEDSKKLSREISSILCGNTDLDLVGSPDSKGTNGKTPLQTVLYIPWFASLSNNNISVRRQEISRERKQKWVFKKSQTRRFDRLVKMCRDKLGADATLQVFGKLGRESGVEDYNALISLCIEEARKTEDEEVLLQQLYNAYQNFKSMTEFGFEIEEQTYGPFLMFLIDKTMVEEFFFLCELIRDGNPNSLSRLAYYEMLLWIVVNNEDKIQELCNKLATDEGVEKSEFKENYLLALCEGGQRKYLLQLLETFDITKVSSMNNGTIIFKSLGRFVLESVAEKFIFAFKTSDVGSENISSFIFDYVISMPNLVVEDVICKFHSLHTEMEVAHSSVSYEKLVKYCCDSLKVHEALNIVDRMFEADLAISINTYHFILGACEKSCEYNLVHRIYSMICLHNVKPNNETFRNMIHLCAKMKDFEGAFGMIDNLKEMDLIPTAGLYNAIIAGYFREKNFHGVSMVLKQMENADVKPDSHTFSYLIGNCDREKNIIKYYEELKLSGVQVTKHIFMALINAYAACGEFEKAKQVVLDKGVPLKSLNEIKSVLVSALASHGQISDALSIYEEIKEAECNLEPKAVICLIEHLESDGELDRLLRLLEELNDMDYWTDGCFRIILYCVRHGHLRSAIDLLKQIKDKFCNDDIASEVLFDEVFSLVAEMEHTGLQIGLDLLQAIKQELGILPSRRSLDFLLSACVNAKDSQSAFFIWKEYQTAGLPYNVLSFVRMYQALLASGDHKSATNILSKIPKDDPHVCCIIKECQRTYTKSTSRKAKKKAGGRYSN